MIRLFIQEEIHLFYFIVRKSGIPDNKGTHPPTTAHASHYPARSTPRQIEPHFTQELPSYLPCSREGPRS
jgi:hypothetical protein